MFDLVIRKRLIDLHREEFASVRTFNVDKAE